MEPPGDTVITLGTSVATKRQYSGTRVPVEPQGYAEVALVYQWSHQEIL